MQINRIMLSLIVLVLPVTSSPAQQAQAPSSDVFARTSGELARWVQIDSNQPESHVYADSVWIGTAESGALLLPSGVTQIILVPVAPDFWSVASLISTLDDVAGGDTLVLELDFPYFYSVESVPSGAEVVFNSGLSLVDVGVTPVIYQSDTPLSGNFVLKKKGYRQQLVTPGFELWNRQLVSLQSESELYLGGSEASTEAPKSRRKWIDYVATSAVIIGGALAVHYKSKANSLYDQYTETGDPALRSQIETLDTQAAIALGTMQVGFTVVVFRLAF